MRIKPTRDVWHAGQLVLADYSIEVSDAALPSYLEDGWELVDDEEEQDEEQTDEEEED